MDMTVTGPHRTERGLTSTELAVVMPVIIALVLVPFQIALWWHARQVAEAAAREGLDAAQVITATEEDGIRAAEWFLDAAGNLTDPDVSVTRTTDTVTVAVTGRAPRIIPGLDWQVAAHASGPVERFIPEEPDR
ncbi:MAG: pilus assembly protein [Acidimicrobiia bacterium]|nr:pilus assembly protein [Acidimicrobiia bacterium]